MVFLLDRARHEKGVFFAAAKMVCYLLARWAAPPGDWGRAAARFFVAEVESILVKRELAE
jgi:hypothetical protein